MVDLQKISSEKIGHRIRFRIKYLGQDCTDKYVEATGVVTDVRQYSYIVRLNKDCWVYKKGHEIFVYPDEIV